MLRIARVAAGPEVIVHQMTALAATSDLRDFDRAQDAASSGGPAGTADHPHGLRPIGPIMARCVICAELLASLPPGAVVAAIAHALQRLLAEPAPGT